MNSLVSICIPTYQRPELVRLTLASCLEQTYRDIEIIISDDSVDRRTERFVAEISSDIPISYRRNSPSLRQAGNVNQLFEMARGDRLMLIHDDDLLLPNAVADLARCWSNHPELTASFGKQNVIDIEGRILTDTTKRVNATYYRTSAYAGYQPSALWSALMGQFPNNGYMIRTDAARAIGYRAESEVGDACDYDFGLRIASAYEEFYFLDTFVSSYRLTPGSIRESNSTPDHAFRLIKELILPAPLEEARVQKLKYYASPAVSRHLRLGRNREALDIFLSKEYPFWQRLTVKGLAQALLILSPARLRERLLRMRLPFSMGKET